MAALTIERLARALYETDPGTNGYPPMHKSIPWSKYNDRSLYERPKQLDRAAEILRLIGERRP